MDRQMVVITTDERQEKLASLLCGKKKCCSWENYQSDKSSCEKVYVLPTPISKLDNALCEKLKEELTTSDNAFVFAGALNKEWVCFFEENNIKYYDFMKLPEVVEGNAHITAEATVAEVLRYSEHSIRGQKMLVTGYGACGSRIAKMFALLGADVTVAARRESVRGQIKEDGFKARDFDEIDDLIGEMHTVVNTVPALVITEERISKMAADSLIIDIASKPGGTDFEAAGRCGIKAKLSLGLPGVYTTTSSAKLLRDAIYKYAPVQDHVSEDQLWIFQIII